MLLHQKENSIRNKSRNDLKRKIQQIVSESAGVIRMKIWIRLHWWQIFNNTQWNCRHKSMLEIYKTMPLPFFRFRINSFKPVATAKTASKSLKLIFRNFYVCNDKSRVQLKRELQFEGKLINNHLVLDAIQCPKFVALASCIYIMATLCRSCSLRKQKRNLSALDVRE